MTLGGYEKHGGDKYNANKHSFTAMRIAGSYHWEVKVSKVGFAGDTFTLSQRVALTDTGTTVTILPSEDWDSLYDMVCGRVALYDVQCVT